MEGGGEGTILPCYHHSPNAGKSSKLTYTPRLKTVHTQFVRHLMWMRFRLKFVYREVTNGERCNSVETTLSSATVRVTGNQAFRAEQMRFAASKLCRDVELFMSQCYEKERIFFYFFPYWFGIDSTS